MADLLQGKQLPDVTTTQTTTQTAPDWYNNFLSGLSSMGANAVQQGGVADLTPLQLQAIGMAPTAINAGQGGLNAASQYTSAAAGTSGVAAADPYLSAGAGSSLNAANPYLTAANGSAYSAAQPYLQAGANGSALNAANPYLTAAGQNAPSNVNEYMNPYIQNVVNEIGRLGERQWRESFAPSVTSGAVGSGQFGSRRGMEVLSNTGREVAADILGKQGGALASGYQSAIQASQADMLRKMQAGQIAGQLSDADFDRMMQAGQLSGQFTDSDIGRRLQAAQLAGQFSDQDLDRMVDIGRARGQLSTQDATNLLAAARSSQDSSKLAYDQAIGGLNTLSTLGEQQRTIEQEKLKYPMVAASNYANLLRGFTVPTTTTQTYKGPMPGAYQKSPLELISGLAAGAGSLLMNRVDPRTGKPVSGSSNLSSIISGIGDMFGIGSGGATDTSNETYWDPSYANYSSTPDIPIRENYMDDIDADWKWGSESTPNDDS